MNFYLLSVFVIICFGPWTTAGEVFLRTRKNSAGMTEDTKRKLNGGGGLPVIKGLVQMATRARTWVQWSRRFLKALRKWCNSHPPEVKLGKCFASYFNIKIPGLRQYEKITVYKEPKETEHLPKMTQELKLKRKVTANQRRVFRKLFQEKNCISFVWELMKKITNRFREYRDVIFSNDLVVCVWDYFWKKFWTWVDSAPESVVGLN